MRKLLALLLVGVMSVGGYFLFQRVREDRVVLLILGFSEALDADIAEHQSVEPERARLPGPVTEGTAFDYYRDAARLLGSDDAMHRGMSAWLRRAEPVPQRVRAVNLKRQPILDLISRGTRATRLGTRAWQSATTDGGEEIFALWALARSMAVDAAVRCEDGDLAGAMRRGIECLRFSWDHLYYTNLFGTYATGGAEVQAMGILQRLLRFEELPKSEIQDAVTILRRHLALRPGPLHHRQWANLKLQHEVRGALAGDAELRDSLLRFMLSMKADSPAAPLLVPEDEQRFRNELVSTWKVLREEQADLARDPPATAPVPGVTRSERVLSFEGSDNRLLSVLARNEASSTENHDYFVEDWCRWREAIILALLAVDHRNRRGAYPEDVEAIRPPEVRSNPGGARWVISISQEPGQSSITVDPYDREEPLVYLR